MAEDNELDTRGLDALVKSLRQAEGMSAVVGILGNEARSDGKSNAAIGLKHELGVGIVQRSWLRMPLENYLPPRIDSGVDKAMADQMIAAKSARPLLERIAILGQQTVLEGFDTGGFGHWPPSNMKFKRVHMTLVETQQLRNSVEYDVVESGGAA